MPILTAVIITHNEERNIGRCLESLRGVADEVVVVDSGSTDRTEAICRQAGAHFVSHPWQGYAGQKNHANSLASGQWILSVDADEALSPALRQSLLDWKSSAAQRPAVYAVNRLNNYCGQWLRHGGWYPDRCRRLFPAGQARWDGEVHEELRSALPQASLDGDLLHYTYYSVADHAERTVRYAPMAGHKAFDEGRRCGIAAVALKPMATFLRDYVLRLGFLDGAAGFAACRMSAFYTFVKYATLRQLCHDPSAR